MKRPVYTCHTRLHRYPVVPVLLRRTFAVIRQFSLYRARLLLRRPMDRIQTSSCCFSESRKTVRIASEHSWKQWTVSPSYGTSPDIICPEDTTTSIFRIKVQAICCHTHWKTRIWAVKFQVRHSAHSAHSPNKLRILSFDFLSELTGHQLNSLVPVNVPHNNTIQQQPISVTQTSHRTLQAPC